MRRLAFAGIWLFSLMSTAQAGLDILPKTGQTACYDSAGNFADCPTTGLGQDGQLQKGIAWPIPRFVDNSNGTITDMLTGLMWLKDANCAYTTGHNPNGGTLTGNMSWLNALDFASKVNTGTVNIYVCSSYAAGHSDWRVPTPRELESLFHYGASPDNVNWLTSSGFVNVKNGYYWTSTTDVSSSGSQSSAVSVNMLSAWIVPRNKAFNTFNPSYTWLARRDTSITTPPAPVIATGQVLCYSATNTVIGCSGTGQDGETQQGQIWPSQRFVDVGDGDTVMDNLTNLIWLKAFPTGNANWQTALNYVIGMNNGSPGYDNYGYTDWHIPNARESLSLISWANYNKAFPTGHLFTFTLGSTTWTSNYSPDGKARAIMTSFYRGGQTTNGKSAGATYLPVRSMMFRSTVGNFLKQVGDNTGGWCLDYVEFETKIPDTVCGPEAGDCFTQAQAAGYYTGSTPKIGSIVIFAKVPGTGLQYGHAGIVIGINGSDITIRDSNWNEDSTTREHVINTSNYNILGYIYP